MLRISCGTEDGFFPANQQLSELLNGHGVKNTFRAEPGAHWSRVWRRDLQEFAAQLFTVQKGI